ncbi:hypothetical protein D9757_009694 [Collybiopsis confluens]|uniref:Uncharacterized protein n=1 Tax=Collybiopsis confluens TaxID=2823264 RepID=A0A8H5M1I9_9AGAR|nr:hypothetical protein D9757_009694 [Collybiopsis confluens]
MLFDHCPETALSSVITLAPPHPEENMSKAPSEECSTRHTLFRRDETRPSDPENFSVEKPATLAVDSSEDLYAPPDGGLKAWSTMVGATLVAFSTFGFANGYGAFSDYYNAVYLTNYSPTLISMIGALQVFIVYTLAGFSGALFDAVGPRNIIPLSGIIVVLSLLLLSFTKPQQIYQQFLCQSVLFSIGGALGFFPAIALMSHWFKLRLPYAVGCVVSGSSLGGILYPIILGRLIPRVGFSTIQSSLLHPRSDLKNS